MKPKIFPFGVAGEVRFFLSLIALLVVIVLCGCGSNGAISASGTTSTTTVPTIASIAVTTGAASISMGATEQFTATATLTDDTKRDVTSTVTWQSLTSSVATMDATTAGLAHGLTAGASVIQATLGAVTGSALLTVQSANSVIGYAYAVSYSAYTVGTIYQYAIGVTGMLNPMNPPTVPAGLESSNIRVHPAGKFVYVTDGGCYLGDGTISQYTVGATGALARTLSSVATGCAFAFDPSGKYAYVGNYIMGDNTISQYAVNSDGTFTPMSSPTVATNGGADSFIVDPTGKYAYVVNRNQGTISQYTVGATGALAPMSPATVTTGLGTLPLPQAIAVDPTGNYLYAANWGDSTVSQYTIGPAGALTPMSPATIATGSGPESITATGRYIYVANCCDATVSQYAINTDGTLTPMSPPTVSGGGGFLAVDPTDKYVYATNSGVSQYLVGATGGLTPMSPPSVTGGGVSIVTIGVH